MRIHQEDKRKIFRFFAQGLSPTQAAEYFSDLPEQDTGSSVSNMGFEKLFEEYLILPIREKLRMTHVVDFVSNRLHRLMDDIADLEPIDILLQKADEKTAISMLDLKRKIKERMAREDKMEVDQPGPFDEDRASEIERAHQDIIGSSRASV